MIVRQRGERRQRLDPSDRFEPAAHVTAMPPTPALERPPHVEVPQRQRLHRQVEPASRAGNRRARRPVRACASAARTWSPSSTRLRLGERRALPSLRAHQAHQRRPAAERALAAGAGVGRFERRLHPGAEQPAERRRDQRTTGRRSSRRSRAARRRWWRGRAPPRGSGSTAAPAASCRPRPRRRTRRARAARRRAASPARRASDPGGSRAPGRARRRPPDGRGRRRAWPDRSTAATTPARGGRWACAPVRRAARSRRGRRRRGRRRTDDRRAAPAPRPPAARPSGARAGPALRG